MTTFPFKNRRVRATFPDHFSLRYERNGYIEASAGRDAPITLRLSLHPSEDLRRPPEFGTTMVRMQALHAGQALIDAGPACYFYAGQDDRFAADDVVIRYWKCGFRSWVVGASATIRKSHVGHPAVAAVEAELPAIFASLEELPRPSALMRLIYRFV
ncbi:MAG: hypothetical protein U0625_07090 [Phycisphaerales bacterium]